MSEFEKKFPRIDRLNEPDYHARVVDVLIWQAKKDGALWALKWAIRNEEYGDEIDPDDIHKEIEELESKEKDK